MTVKVRNLRIGEGRPKICVPVMGRKKEEILSAAQAAVKRPQTELVEWRADDYENVFRKSDVDDMLAALRTILGEIPLLVTFRTKAEGGRKAASDKDYADFLEGVFASRQADMVDIEFMSGAAAKAVQTAKLHGIVTVLSNHEFFKTPPKPVITDRLEAMAQLGADIVKMAVMPEKPEDVLTLLWATIEAKQRLSCPVVTMAMGQLGLISRLCGQQFGSALTFGAVGEISAPGQIDAGILYETLKLFEEKESEQQWTSING